MGFEFREVLRCRPLSPLPDRVPIDLVDLKKRPPSTSLVLIIDEVALLLKGRTAAPDAIEYLRLLALRYPNKEIARELLVSAATVKKHTVSLYQKLHVSSRREAVEKATALGYLHE